MHIKSPLVRPSSGLSPASRVYPICGTPSRAEVGQAQLPMPSTSCCWRASGLAPLARGWWNDALLRSSFHHFRHEEVVVLGRRRIPQHRVHVATLRHHVRALLYHHRRHRGHRFYPGHIDLGKLLDERQDGVDLASQMLGLVVGNRNPRQVRDAADGLVVNGHRKPQKRPKRGPDHPAYSRGVKSPATAVLASKSGASTATSPAPTCRAAAPALPWQGPG